MPVAKKQWCCMQTEPSIANRPFMVQSERIWQWLQKCSLVLQWLEYFWINGNEAMIESDFWCSQKVLRWKTFAYTPTLKELVYFKYQSIIVSFLMIFLFWFLASNCDNNIVSSTFSLCATRVILPKPETLIALCLCFFNSCHFSVLCCKKKQQVSCKIQ